jgi:hypothetical protein
MLSRRQLQGFVRLRDLNYSPLGSIPSPPPIKLSHLFLRELNLYGSGTDMRLKPP